MAIKRCPYCRAIIDERDQYCNNCGTQLLFPEDEFIEEDIPGEKVVDVDEKPAGEEAGLDLDMSLEEPGSKPEIEKEVEPELVLEPQVSPRIPISATSLGFPQSLTGDLNLPKRGRKSKKTEDEVVPEPVPEPKVRAEEPAPGMLFKETFPEKDQEDEPVPSLEPEEEIIVERAEPASPARTAFREGSLSASTDEIEEIARLMSSLEKKDEEPEAPFPERIEKKPSEGPAPSFEKRFNSFRDEYVPSPAKDRTGEFPEDLLRTVEVPPWMVDKKRDTLPSSFAHPAPPPPSPFEPIKTQDLPEFGQMDESTSPTAPSSDLGDIFKTIEDQLQAPTQEPELEVNLREPQPAADEADLSWDDISGREISHTDFLADRLGRGHREEVEDRPRRPRRSGGGSKIMARVYDLLIIAACWASAVWLSTRIMSVPVSEIFNTALVQLGLLLLTLAVAYYFLFLYFLGETLGDRLASQ